MTSIHRDDFLKKEQKPSVPAYKIIPPLTKEDIEKQVIYSSQFQTKGRIQFTNDSCYILANYSGKEFRFEFPAVFREEDLPWIWDAALMKLESEIEDIIFREKASLEGEMTDEW